MKKIFFCSFLFVLLFACNSIRANKEFLTLVQKPAELKSIIDVLEAHRQSVKSFQSSFKQSRIILPFNDVEKADGDFYFFYPDKIIWEFKSPEKNKILIKGKRGYIIADDLKQVQVFAIDDTSRFDFLLAGLGQPIKTLFDDFDIKCFKGVDNEGTAIYRFSMVPITDNLKDIVKKFELVINARTKNPVSSKLTEVNGDVTELFFENIQINGSLKKSIFEYKIPTDYKVIDYY
ncbi:outer membrane lipoprotein carrier protein LolA [bacterium]|nr:outer membrane lipoprotein carrier protein LolA [bacterium]